MDKIIPCLVFLQYDNYEHVRLALADNILTLCPLIGAESTEKYLIPIVSELFKDSNFDVRFRVFMKLDDLHIVYSID